MTFVAGISILYGIDKIVANNLKRMRNEYLHAACVQFTNIYLVHGYSQNRPIQT